METSACALCPVRRWRFWASLLPLPPDTEPRTFGCSCESHCPSVFLLGDARLIRYLWHGLEETVPSGLHGDGDTPCSSPRNLHSQNASCLCHCGRVSHGIVSIH